MQDKLAEAQRKELDLNDQLQLHRDQLEATKVLYCLVLLAIAMKHESNMLIRSVVLPTNN